MKDQVFTPLPKPLVDLFLKLTSDSNLIVKMSQRAIPKRLLKYYDQNAQREYHSCEIRHDMNNWW